MSETGEFGAQGSMPSISEGRIYVRPDDRLTAYDLKRITENPSYRSSLADLVAAYSHSEGYTSGDELGDNADSVVSEQLGCSTDHTHLIARTGGGADPSPSDGCLITRARGGADPSPSDGRLISRARGGADTSLSDGCGTGNLLKRPSRTEPGKAKRNCLHRHEARSVSSGFHSDSDSPAEESCFDPSWERDDKEECKVKVPPVIGKYLDKHFRQPLSKEGRTAMLKKHPKPDVEAVVSPRLDSFVVDFAGKKLDKAKDAQLARIQGTMLYAANPITCLWADLVEQGLTHNPKDAIYVPDLLEVLQRALVLLGNANHLISEMRRENALESIHPSLKKYGRGDFTQAKGALFGDVFKDELVKKVEADSALSKAVNIVSKNSFKEDQDHSRPSQGFQGRTSQYGAVSGRYYHPYKSQGQGRFNPDRPFNQKSTIFGCLGPGQSDRRTSASANGQQHE